MSSHAGDLSSLRTTLVGGLEAIDLVPFHQSYGSVCPKPWWGVCLFMCTHAHMHLSVTTIRVHFLALAPLRSARVT